jgi:hypothetical protein
MASLGIKRRINYAKSWTIDWRDLPAVSVYRFADGRTVGSRMFHFDTAMLLRFLGETSAGTG